MNNEELIGGTKMIKPNVGLIEGFIKVINNRISMRYNTMTAISNIKKVATATSSVPALTRAVRSEKPKTDFIIQ